MPSKTLAIVIPAWNNWQYTKKVIQQLSALPDDHKVIVVDNGSTDETNKLQNTKSLEVVRHTDNLGFAKGCNSGFAHAVQLKYENVLFLNNDIKVLENLDSWTNPLIVQAERGCIAGPTVGCLDDNLNFKCEVGKWPTKGYGYLSGWCICASVAIWDKLTIDGDLGPFSTNFFSYFEDTDLSFRAKLGGFHFSIVPVPVRHIGRATSKKLGLSSMYQQSKKTFLELWEKRTEELHQIKG
jgi:GT2 family glycosyltransferase